MAYAKKTKKRGTSQKGKTRRRKGVFGVTAVKAPTSNQILDLVKQGALMTAGFVAGGEISRRLGDQTGVKKFMGPVISAGGGYVLTRMKNQNLKFIGLGLVGRGLIDGVGKAVNKDFVANGVLSGLRGLGDLRELISGPSEPALPFLPEFNGGAAPVQEVIDAPHVVIS
jgi:hypothetical protein